MNKNKVNQNKGITNMVSKEDSNNELKSKIVSAATVAGVIVFAFLVTFLCTKITNKDVNAEDNVTIGTNSAEESFYNADYDAAISKYESMQEKEEWPINKVKEAEVYSVKGEYAASNRLLAESYDTRDKLIRKNGIEKYKEEDEELGNLIAFTALMNGDVEKALEYGEIFVLDDGNNEKMDKTLFAAYLANDNKDKAQEILNNIDYDENSAIDLAEIAYMNIIMDHFDEGIKYLNEAYNLDKNEVKIYDVLKDVMAYNNRTLMDKLKKLSKSNPKELSYKVFLLKCYSLDRNETENAKKMLAEVNNEGIDSSILSAMEADIYKNAGEKDKYNEVIKTIVNKEDKSYFEYYITAKYEYENKNYADGILDAKYSIIANRDFVGTYADIMPELLGANKESDKAEGYLRTALYNEPYNCNIMIRLADYCASVKQDYDKALNYYNLAVKMDSDNSVIYYNMGVAKTALDKKDEGIKLLEHAIKLNGNEPKYYRKLGAAYLNIKENDKAIKAIRKAYSINEKDIKTLNAAGYYYMSVNEIDRAVTNFKAAYEGINNDTDLNVKNIITNNYEKAKEYSDNKNKWTKSVIEEFKLAD